MAYDPKQLIADLESAISLYEGGLTAALPSAEKAAMDEIMRIISDLSLNGKRIKATTDNLRKLRGFNEQFSTVVATPELKKAVMAFVVGYASTAQDINKYFLSIDPKFRAERGVFEAIFEQTRAATLNSMLGAGMKQTLVKPIGDILLQNITTGGSLADLEAQLRGYLIGQPRNIGALATYAKQITFDSIQQFNRTYIEAITVDLSLPFCLYEGPIKETTRPFCKQHASKFYHRNEVKEWAKQSWSGKIPGTTPTSIFIYCGGYKCRHYIIPVSQEAVPQDVIDRNIANGNFKNSQD